MRMQQCKSGCGMLYPSSWDHPWESEHHQRSCSPKYTPICSYVIDGIWYANLFLTFLIIWGILL